MFSFTTPQSIVRSPQSIAPGLQLLRAQGLRLRAANDRREIA